MHVENVDRSAARSSAARSAYTPLLPPGPADMFWAEIAPRDHLVQMYQSCDAFLNALEGYVAGGLGSGESEVVIATKAHREALDERLRRRGFDIESLTAQDRYIALDAEETLARFMTTDGWPDEARFAALVRGLIRRASQAAASGQRAQQRSVRAFGEMVAVLWARGHSGATVRLEHLWHKLCQEEGLKLFCAYPRIAFAQDASTSMAEICALHSNVIPG